MKHNFSFNNCVDIILCELTYNYIKKLGFDYYWVIYDEVEKIKHLYPIFSEDNVYGILYKNESSLISTSDLNLLESIDKLEYTYYTYQNK